MGENLPAKKKPDNQGEYVENPRGEIVVSVRRLVEFILRSGDIDKRHQGGGENAMLEGGRIHRMIQKRMGAEYHAEVPLKGRFPASGYDLIVEGRADGIVDMPGKVLIDEIKGTYRELGRMKGPDPLHVAQAKCYAYLYALEKGHARLSVRITYCNMETEEIRYFHEEVTFEAVEKWFLGLLDEYRKWSDHTWEWRKIRQQSLEQMEFPFPYRDGQKELVTYVYQTIYHKKKLFIEAPTGVGKTISTIFPSLKAMSRQMGEKLFYLTAKTIARTVADDTLELLRENGLRFKSIVLTAKEKICFVEKMECKPETCPYARGHYDRINAALYDMLTKEDRFSREKLEEYAKKHMVCPFEMGLDLSLFADGIICDYNYVFDPHVYLRRFFESGGGDYLFLIDEAHNLLERGRKMYSAELVKDDFLELKRDVQEYMASQLREAEKENAEGGTFTLQGDKTEEDGENEQLTLGIAGVIIPPAPSKSAKKSKESKKDKKKQAKSVFVRDGYAQRISNQLEKCNKELLLLKRDGDMEKVVEEIDGFVNAVIKLYGTMSDYLEEQEMDGMSIRENLLDFYFALSHFLDIYERLDENYVKYTQLQADGRFLIKLLCVNPRNNLKECMMRGRSSILFSATLLPIQYYKELLGGEAEDFEVYAKSVFNNEKRALFIANDVTSKYTRRSDEEFLRIAAYINSTIQSRRGNYMVFCPSYAFMQKTYEFFAERYASDDVECVMQKEMMSESEREDFLMKFQVNQDLDLQGMIHMEVELEEGKTLVGFCVLGGIFSEGIDLKNDSLIGAIVVGTGIPQVCFERELLKRYFDGQDGNGFDYAYRFPGMNKVLQAAGRVIRTQNDVGVIVLLDERFLQISYRKLFPREWDHYEVVNKDALEKKIERFWDSWGKYE